SEAVHHSRSPRGFRNDGRLGVPISRSARVRAAPRLLRRLHRSGEGGLGGGRAARGAALHRPRQVRHRDRQRSQSDRSGPQGAQRGADRVPRPVGPLKDVDSAERAHLLKVAVFFGPACFVMLSMLWYFFLRQQLISGGVFLVLLILNVPITIAGIFGINHAVGATSTGLVKTMLGAGNIPPPRTYPRQDVLIVRGQYA